MKIDWTLRIKETGGNRISNSYYKKYNRYPKMPKHWDKNNFITWIICGEPPNPKLPKILNYWDMK